MKKEEEEAGHKITRELIINQEYKEKNRLEDNKNIEDNILKTIKANLLIYPLFFKIIFYKVVKLTKDFMNWIIIILIN